MSRKDELFEHVLNHVIIGVVREENADDAWEIAQAYAESGLRVIEVTMTTPEAVAIVSRLSERYGERGVVIAAGTVRSTDDASAARRAGAEVIVSPHTDRRVIEYSIEHDLLSVAGAATATEIIRAWELGAGVIKVYPAGLLGGPEYIRTVRQPIRGIPMLAGGPVPLELIDSYLDAGCVALNLGGSLAGADLVRAKNWTEIGRRVTMAISAVNAWKQQRHSSELVH